MRLRALLLMVVLTLLNGCLAAIMKRDPMVSTDLPVGFNYLGCYQDSPQNRQLTGTSYTDASDMTEESCIAFCSSRGFEEAGLEYSSECYCGHQFQSEPLQVDDSDCNMPCSGNPSESCGAANRLTVFSNGNAAPVTNPGTDDWALQGCYSDSVTSRTLSTFVMAGRSPALTVSACIQACKDADYPYAGVENGNECYCDIAIRNNAQIEPSSCDTTCSGNSSKYCGGAFRLDIYRRFDYVASTIPPLPAGWTSLGCYNDNPSSRTLRTAKFLADGVTVEVCLNRCRADGFRYAGLEYGYECYCDNQIEDGASVTSDPSMCHYPCSGNVAETCGGASVLSLYSYQWANVSMGAFVGSTK